MSDQFRILSDALSIPGARSVAVFAAPARTRLWSVTASGSEIDDAVVTTAMDMASAAQQLVERFDPGSQVEEILALDDTWIHVLYPLTDVQSGLLVAHVLLDRKQANLGPARREFRELVEGELAAHRDRPPPPAARTGPLADQRDLGALPRRATVTLHGSRPAPAAPAADTEGAVRPPDNSGRSWLEDLMGPFSDDMSTLRRVLAGLRRL